MKNLESKQDLWGHLDELLLRARRIFVWTLLGSVIGYIYSEQIMLLFQQPLLAYTQDKSLLVFTKPFEKLWVYVRLSFFLGIIFAFPFIFFELASFVGPALYQKEKKKAYFLVSSFTVVFILGVLAGYKWVLPIVLKTLMLYGSADLLPMLTISAYVNMVLGLLFFTAIFFEIPVVMVHLSAWGWVQSSTWKKGRKLAFVGNATIAAFLSPPDPLSMIIMMIPLQILYEIGIWVAHLAEQKKSST